MHYSIVLLTMYRHMVAETLEELKDSESLSKSGTLETLDEVNWFAFTSTVYNVFLIYDSFTPLQWFCICNTCCLFMILLLHLCR